MKNMLRIIIVLFIVTAATAAEEYNTFTIPFRQSKDKERVIVEIPSYPIDYGSSIRFPEPGIYILNKPEVLKKELENTGEYRVYTAYVARLIIGLVSILVGINLAMLAKKVSGR